MTEVCTTDADYAAALRAAGARLVRHGHDMVLDLGTVRPAPDWASPQLPAGARLASIEEGRRGYAAAAFLAYPPPHPDAVDSFEEAEARMREVLVQGGAGPIVSQASAVVIDSADDAVVAAIVITRQPAQPWGWHGGLWVAEIFVVPAHQGRGLGAALLRRAIAQARADGERWMGLTVTDGNPAERLYARLGFERRRSMFVLETG